MLLTFLSFVIVIGLLTMAHEFGHFATAKRSGMQVDEFALGMGPSLFGTVFRGTRYQVNLLPIGGYVKIAGMDGESDDSPGSFNNKPLLRRMIVILAGSVMNLLLAAVVFILLGVLQGRPETTSFVERVVPDTPAIEAGIRQGDRVLGADGQRWSKTADIQKYISSRPGRRIDLLVERKGREITLPVVPDSFPGFERRNGKVVEVSVGRIGIVFKQNSQPMGILEALVFGVSQAASMTAAILVSIFMMLTGQVPASSISGPVGIAREVGSAARTGIFHLLFWLAALSANVGIFNLLPFPALDGGRFAFLVVEALRGGRKLDPRKEGIVHFAGLVLLLLLIAIVTVRELF